MTTSVYARTYRCEGISGSRVNKEEKTLVVIKELKEVTNSVPFGKHYDRVYVVKVDIAKILGNKIIFARSFLSYATSADVEYTVSSLKKEGVRIHIFLDEADQAGIEITGANGTRQKIHLSCK